MMRVLIIVQPHREDFYRYLTRDHHADYLLLWDVEPADTPAFFKERYTWSRFATPAQVLDTIRPDKIVFFEIIDQRQIALLIVANARGISTFYLEHGAAADPATALERSKPNQEFYRRRLAYLGRRVTTGLSEAFKTKFFYLAAFGALKNASSRLRFLSLPVLTLFKTPNHALRSAKFRERVPRHAITFNRVNFEEYELYTGASPDSAILTGLPMYDEFFQSTPRQTDEVVYIDHPYLEERLLGWTPEHHQRVAQHLQDFAKNKGLKLLIKLHPRSDLARWQSYQLDPNHIELAQVGNFQDRYLGARLILGFSSSLLMGFLCAQKNLVLLGWHPNPRIFGFDFSRTGLCHVSMAPDELNQRYEHWCLNNLTKTKPDAYHIFLSSYNHPFDGHAADRVIEAIHTR